MRSALFGSDVCASRIKTVSRCVTVRRYIWMILLLSDRNPSLLRQHFLVSQSDAMPSEPVCDRFRRFVPSIRSNESPRGRRFSNPASTIKKVVPHTSISASVKDD